MGTIYVDEREPRGEVESQFQHRKVTFKRSKDVRAGYDMIDEIGRGKFGRVMKCRRRETGEIFAAKFVTCATREDRRNVEREVEIMNLLKSQKLLQLYEAWDNGRSEMCLITEYIGGGELFDRVIEDEFVLSEKACCIFTKQILEGVTYIHRQQIIHLDLKPENILCLTKSGNRIKIIDFGLARRFEPMKKLQILFGTPEFVAPEVVNFEPIGYSTDMWALGVITYVLVSGLSPFMGDTDLETMANVTIAEYDYEDEAFDNVSCEAKDFIDSLLVKEQGKRATAEKCLDHPWLKSLPGPGEEDDEDESLSLATDNLKQQRNAWNNRDSNYYLFDSKSRTASQLYETDLPLSITARMVEQMEVANAGQGEDDTFSFFTSDGTVRSDSQLVVLPDGKIEKKVEAPPQPTVGERKRSLEDVRPKGDTIEYIGLVKRPKTPLITAGDILKQAQTLSERKASACGSLPDIVSSSVDATELHASRCSLLEGEELPDDGTGAGDLPATPVPTLLPPPAAALPELPLPDIVATEEEGRDVPPIFIEEAGEVEEVEECPACEPIVASPQPPGLTKDYTVEEGFERPEGGWQEEGSVAGASMAAACDSDEEDGEGLPHSSSSSSLPSESSGIFYKAEYTPHPSHVPSPAPGMLSIENRDSYWSSFFHKDPAAEVLGRLRKSSSGSGERARGLPPRPNPVTKSKSDAKVNYSEAELHLAAVAGEAKVKDEGPEGEPPPRPAPPDPAYFEQARPEVADLRDVQECAPDMNGRSGDLGDQYNQVVTSEATRQEEEDFPEMAALRREIVLPRSLRSPKNEEVDVQPWTELSTGHSPESSNSRDNLSSTISQEMQDLLSSIQSLGKTDSGESAKSLLAAGRRLSQGKEAAREAKVNLNQLMAEVENQIRFSATAELLERMAACPSVEEGLAEVPRKQSSPARLGGSAGPCHHPPTPPVPDLLRAALESPPSPPFSTSLDSPGNLRRVTLARPSDMAGVRAFTPTGRVPDMLARVSVGKDSPDPNYSSFESVRDDLSKVRSDIDSLRESLNETKTNVAANSRDILARCSFFNDPADGEGKPSSGSGSTLESDLAETSSAMREIERTVNSFSRPNSLPTGKVESSSTPSPRRIFAGSKQGSVTKTKDRFEQRELESRLPVPLAGPRTRPTTPFSSTRSPSPAFDSRDKKRQLSVGEPESPSPFRGRTGTGTRLNLRKRSPSPVVTGKVSSFRNKFENSPSYSNNNASTVPRGYRASPFRERISPPQATSPTKAEGPGRLPSHFVPMAGPTRTSVSRAQSLRAPRHSLQTGPSTSEAATLKAANFLRSTLPRKSLPETPSYETSKHRGPFGYNRI